MEDWQLRRYATALQAKEAELICGLNNRDGLATEAEPDFFDEIQRAADRALLIESLYRNSSLLRHVRAALLRIADGSYGQCLRCEEDITPKRLAAVPWAALCLHCQEADDMENAERSEALEFAVTG